jgi:DNA-binding beta-propeller fold protein YncE
VRLSSIFLVGAVAALPVGASAAGYTFSTLAGSQAVPGSADGTGSAARFLLPQGIAIDAQGNIYIADTNNDTIRMVTSGGSVTTIAGSPGQVGTADGPGPSARFNSPEAIAADGNGNLYVADTLNSEVRMITFSGGVATVSTLANSSQVSNIGGIAVDGAGDTVYVAETSLDVIQQISISGGMATVSTLAGLDFNPGYADGDGSTAQFSQPEGLVLAGPGLLYVADTGNSVIRQISISGGIATVSTVAGTAGTPGSADGPAGTALLYSPQAIAIDASGNVFVADTFTDTIREITNPAMASPTVSTVAGVAYAAAYLDGSSSAARFDLPGGLAVDSSGNVFVADTSNSVVREISGGVVSTFAGANGAGADDGTGASARFAGPAGVAVDGMGNVYVADSSNNTIRMVTPAGVVTTLAGSPGLAGFADGPGASALFDLPTDIAVNAAGTVAYVADAENGKIRKLAISAGAATVSTVVGPINGGVFGVALDATGDVFFTSTGLHAVFEIPAAGGIISLAGNYNFPGSSDGVGVYAEFEAPVGIVSTPDGTTLYVADQGNFDIRKVTVAAGVGTVTTIAGHPHAQGYLDGPGPSAYFTAVWGIALDGSGNLFVVDEGNEVIREISPAGVVSTVAGTPQVKGYADGAGASVEFDIPLGIAVDGQDNLYVADDLNYSIREGVPGGAAPSAPMLSAPVITTQPVSQEVAPGAAVLFSVTDAANPAPTYQWDLNGFPIPGATLQSYSIPAAFAPQAGTYTVEVTNSQGSATSDPATLTVDAPPAVGESPQSVSVVEGNNAGFTVTGSGVPAPAYQWEVSSNAGLSWADLMDGTYVSGATTPSLELLGVTTALDGNEYECSLTNTSGSATSAYATLDVTLPFVIVTQPASQAVNAGSDVVLVVEALGDSPYSYQWTFNGTPISGATGATLSLKGVQPSNAGSYQVIVTGGSGESESSNAAALAVNPDSKLVFSSEPASEIVASGGTVVFTATAPSLGLVSNLAKPSGWSSMVSAAATFQWRFNGANLTDGGGISGSTGPQLVISGAGPNNVGDYACIVTTGGVSTQTNTASLLLGSTSNPGYLVNFSARGFVGTGQNILIGGFYIGGNTSCTVLIQALGPALGALGVTGALQHPALAIHDSTGATMYANTGWGSSQLLLNAAAAAYAQPPLQMNSGDSEVLLTLPPGGYTAEISGADGGTGIALCAMYQIP